MSSNKDLGLFQIKLGFRFIKKFTLIPKRFDCHSLVHTMNQVLMSAEDDGEFSKRTLNLPQSGSYNEPGSKPLSPEGG